MTKHGSVAPKTQAAVHTNVDQMNDSNFNMTHARHSIRLKKMNAYSNFKYRVEIRKDDNMIASIVPFGSHDIRSFGEGGKSVDKRDWATMHRDRIISALDDYDILNPIIIEWRVLWCEHSIKLGLVNLYRWLRLNAIEMRREAEFL